VAPVPAPKEQSYKLLEITIAEIYFTQLLMFRSRRRNLMKPQHTPAPILLPSVLALADPVWILMFITKINKMNPTITIF
jgi:hypothetical protein